MSWQHVELNMIPGGELPVVHVSQFDTLRAFHFDLKVGEDDWTIPEGIHFELHCRKVDDNIVIIAPDSTDTSSVTFTTTEQLTACSGKNECELVAIDDEDDSLIIGSINFILDVEADPLAGGLNSETAIYNLTVQIEDIISSEGYLKSDDVSPVALTGSYNDLTDKPTIPDMSNYYTKYETYNKTQVDDALSLKANTAELATVATTGNYDDLTNKPTIPAAQVNSDWNAVSGVAEILNKPTIPTNTSDLNNDSDFITETEIENMIDALLPTIVASGTVANFNTAITDKPLNITCDVSATTITRVNENFAYLQNSQLFPTGDGLSIEVNVETHSAYAKVKKNTEYTFIKHGTTNRTYIYGCDSEPALGVIVHSINFTTTGTNCYSFNSGNYEYIALYFSNEATEDISCVYGAVSEVGAYVETSSTDFPVSDINNINALEGVNNIYADVGDISVSAKDTIQHYIDNH